MQAEIIRIALALHLLRESFDSVATFDFAFPDYEYAPTVGFQLGADRLVSILVAGELGGPPISPRAWNPKVLATFMAVPEATMDENDRPATGEYQVGRSWEPRIIQAISEPSCPHCTSNY